MIFRRKHSEPFLNEERFKLPRETIDISKRHTNLLDITPEDIKKNKQGFDFERFEKPVKEPTAVEKPFEEVKEIKEEIPEELPSLEIPEAKEEKEEFEEVKPVVKERVGFKPIFVNISEYENSLAHISQSKNILSDIDRSIETSNDIKNIKDSEFEKFHNKLEDIERKLLYVDRKIFEVVQ